VEVLINSGPRPAVAFRQGRSIVQFLNFNEKASRYEVNRWGDLKPFWLEVRQYVTELGSSLLSESLNAHLTIRPFRFIKPLSNSFRFPVGPNSTGSIVGSYASGETTPMTTSTATKSVPFHVPPLGRGDSRCHRNIRERLDHHGPRRAASKRHSPVYWRPHALAVSSCYGRATSFPRCGRLAKATKCWFHLDLCRDGRSRDVL